MRKMRHKFFFYHNFLKNTNNLRNRSRYRFFNTTKMTPVTPDTPIASHKIKGKRFRNIFTYSLVIFGTLSVSIWSFSYILDSIPEIKLIFKKVVEKELSKRFETAITITNPPSIDLLSNTIIINNMRMQSLPTHLPYSVFDFTIQTTKISISLLDFLIGKRDSIIECEMQGLRGVIDKRHLVKEKYSEQDWSNLSTWRYTATGNNNNNNTNNNTQTRHSPSFKSTTIKDAIFTILVDKTTTHNVNIISADFPQLRPTHLLIDLMMASSVSGILNGNCLFSIHKPPLLEDLGSANSANSNGIFSPKRLFKLHSLPVSLLTNSAVVDYKEPSSPSSSSSSLSSSPLSWITRGLVDVDILIDVKEEERFDFDVQLKFHNLHAKIPSFSRSAKDCKDSLPQLIEHKGHKHHLLRRTLMRPIVAYLNEQKPFIPLHCSWSTPTSHLEGCWTLWESGLLEELSFLITDSFYEVVVKRELLNSGRVRRISLWSLYALLRGFLFTTPPPSPPQRELLL